MSSINSNTSVTTAAALTPEEIQKALEDARRARASTQTMNADSGNQKKNDVNAQPDNVDPLVWQQALAAKQKMGIAPQAAKSMLLSELAKAKSEGLTSGVTASGMAFAPQAGQTGKKVDGDKAQAQTTEVGKAGVASAQAQPQATSTAKAEAAATNATATTKRASFDTLETKAQTPLAAANTTAGTGADGLEKAAKPKSLVATQTTSTLPNMADLQPETAERLAALSDNEAFQAMLADVQAKDGKLNANQLKVAIMDASPELNEAQATEMANVLTANLQPDENGMVDTGNVKAGVINLAQAQSKAAESPANQEAVAKMTEVLRENPQFASRLALATTGDAVKKVMDDMIAQGVIDAVAPTDENGKKLSSMSTGMSSGKGKKISMNPMEMVMMAMLEAGMEAQKAAASLAEEVQANTEYKKQLREAKSGYSSIIAQQKEETSAATDKENANQKGDDSVQSKVDSMTIGSLISGTPTTDDSYYLNQAKYDRISSALDGAGDDSSILMIKLQTASQIVTTFLQACSNVSKGVTDTTKAVIGNIGR